MLRWAREMTDELEEDNLVCSGELSLCSLVAVHLPLVPVNVGAVVSGVSLSRPLEYTQPFPS